MTVLGLLHILVTGPLSLMQALAVRIWHMPVLLNLQTLLRAGSAGAARVGWPSVTGATQTKAGSHEAEISHGIDCTCYYSENFFVTSPIEGHFTFEGAEAFREEQGELLSTLGEATGDELVRRLVVVDAAADSVEQAPVIGFLSLVESA